MQCHSSQDKSNFQAEECKAYHPTSTCWSRKFKNSNFSSWASLELNNLWTCWRYYLLFLITFKKLCSKCFWQINILWVISLGKGEITSIQNYFRTDLILVEDFCEIEGLKIIFMSRDSRSNYTLQFRTLLFDWLSERFKKISHNLW